VQVVICAHEIMHDAVARCVLYSIVE